MVDIEDAKIKYETYIECTLDDIKDYGNDNEFFIKANRELIIFKAIHNALCKECVGGDVNVEEVVNYFIRRIDYYTKKAHETNNTRYIRARLHNLRVEVVAYTKFLECAEKLNGGMFELSLDKA